MDETLLHSRFTSAENNFRQSEVRKETNGDYDFTLVFHSQEGGYERVFVARRPCVEEFLKQLSSFAEVVVFTAALEEYAKPVLDEIDQGGWITHRLYRQSTRPFKNHKFVKDMSIMGRDLARIVLVDNNPMAMIASPDNAIPIQSWFDNPFDHELLKVHALCYEMKDMKDVRPFLEQKLQFRAGMEKLGLVDPRPVVIPTMSNTRNVNGKTTSASTAFSLSMNSVPSSLKDDAVYKPSKRKVRNQNSNTSRLRNI